MSSNSHRIATREQWDVARSALLQEEKQLQRLRDALSEKRRALPWVPVTEPYCFETPEGTRSLSALFGAHSQLIVYHLMFAPDWAAACKSCSFWAENFDRHLIHLAHRDVRLVAISRAPLSKLQAYAARMGWQFPWVSSGESRFNRDFAVSFSEAERESRERLYNYGTLAPMQTDMPGFSVFAKDAGGAVFHTYSTYARGIEPMNAGYAFLDLV
ncbi:MAG TPA: DUF899 domain-containing protein, partial [Polyangiales bacterium]